MIELQTGGFYALPDEDGSVFLSIPGFEETRLAGAPTLPVKLAWLEAVVGRQVRIVSMVGRDVVAFTSLRPSVVGEAAMFADANGTVSPRMRRRAAMWADPEWLGYIKKLNESGYLVEQRTSLMIPTKFCPIKR